MAKLWLTYAWKDNEDQDVDHVVAELRARGIDLAYDRVELLAGMRLWEQIDAGINDPTVTAWAMLVTENSLRSEPCQEEIAYALDRTLRAMGTSFPLIGIFPQPIDRALIPSAIATRLYVNLRDPSWAEQIADAVQGQRRVSTLQPVPYGFKLHYFAGKPVVEVWPRSGRWSPFTALVPASEATMLEMTGYGPRGQLPGATMLVSGEAASEDGTLKGRWLEHPVDALDSGRIFFSALPSEVHFGQPDAVFYRVTFNTGAPSLD